MSRDDLTDFAHLVLTAADEAATDPTNCYGERVFLGPVKATYSELFGAELTNDLILALHREGLINLDRADLAGDTDRQMLAESTVRHPMVRTAEFHLLARRQKKAPRRTGYGPGPGGGSRALWGARSACRRGERQVKPAPEERLACQQHVDYRTSGRRVKGIE